ncbi:hypothetical protein ACFYV5_11740 [Streptomyces sp. NPDC003035]|uniref:hypothetical protein n=1 Tax=Streptomyces sp. NPDC003035 TaxID=3364676 RepID=UPI0036CAB7F6
MAVAGGAMSELIESACRTMSRLAVSPLALEIDPGEARVLAVMPEDALDTRSRGPYSPDNLPPEAMSVIDWIALLWSVEPERPAFTIEGGGPWPALVLTLPVSRVRVHFMVPEAAPWPYPPDPGNGDLGTHVNLALRFVAGTLERAAGALGAEPPVALSLSYPADPSYEERLAFVHESFHDHLPSVVPTIEVDRSRCTRKQRAAHDEAVRAGAYTDQHVLPLGRSGFTTRVGLACVRDSGG